MTTLISFAALFVSIVLVQLGSGSLGPLDALAGSVRGFTTAEIGLMGSAHYVGFFIGCFLTPRLVGTVGHERCFAAAAAVGAIGALLHPILDTPLAWAGLRVLTGISISAAYTVVESWLQAKTANHNRGRVYGVFRLVDIGGQIVAQAMIAVLDPATYVAYNIVAVFCCLCLLPLTLSRAAAPLTTGAPRLRPLKVLAISPSACTAVIVAGLTSASFRMVGPVYGLGMGLGQGEIALFLTMVMIGGIAAQYPVGWIADLTDRRKVMIGLSFASIACCFAIGWAMPPGVPWLLMAGALVFGLTTYPLYSVAAAYANDNAPEGMSVELNAALMFFFSVGAIVSPGLTAVLIAAYGPGALFLFVAGAHFALVLFALYRMTRRGAARPVTPYSYVPRTSMVLGRLFGRATVSDRGSPAGKRRSE